MTDYAHSAWGHVVSYLAADAEAVSNGNEITDPATRNAVAHAHTSAEWSDTFGQTVAEELGNLKEMTSDDPLHSIKDQYTNDVGRRIAEYVENNNLPASAIDDIIMDALNNGELIVDENTDPRVANGTQPSWNGPAPNWQGSSAGRDYSGTGYGMEAVAAVAMEVPAAATVRPCHHRRPFRRTHSSLISTVTASS